jgi:DNA-binding transcriptional regulator YdaS (Cro superfamily)
MDTRLFLKSEVDLPVKKNNIHVAILSGLVMYTSQKIPCSQDCLARLIGLQTSILSCWVRLMCSIWDRETLGCSVHQSEAVAPAEVRPTNMYTWL